MVIYDIREVLRTSVEKKLKADITDAGTMLDGTGADFAFKLKGRQYNIQIDDITEDEKKPKETTQKEWVKGYKKWKEGNDKNKLRKEI